MLPCCSRHPALAQNGDSYHHTSINHVYPERFIPAYTSVEHASRFRSNEQINPLLGQDNENWIRLRTTLEAQMRA